MNNRLELCCVTLILKFDIYFKRTMRIVQPAHQQLKEARKLRKRGNQIIAVVIMLLKTKSQNQQTLMLILQVKLQLQRKRRKMV